MNRPLLNLSFHEESDYLLVTIQGRYDPLPITEALGRIKAQAQQSQRSRILIDAYQISRPEKDIDRFLVGRAIADQLPAPLRIAVLCVPEWITRFAEDTAVNRGAQMFVSGDKAEALQWLLGTSGRA